MATQANSILSYLNTGRTLTSLEALNLFSCSRLASRICDLKKLGHNVQRNMIKVKSGKVVAEYWMPQEPVQTTLGFEEMGIETFDDKESMKLKLASLQ